MTVTNVEKDAEALTLTLTAEFAAPVAQVWQQWADPRKLERWWGPPTYPATVVDHDLSPGGAVAYFMTGPDGAKFHGWWRILTVDAPNGLSFEDGFADDSGAPSETMPVSVIRVSITESAGATRMAIETTFPSTAAMEQLISMGMAEGMAEAVGQLDALLAA